MKRVLLLAVVFLLPAGLFASTIESGNTLVISEPVSENAYVFGGELTIAAPVTGDLTAVGGSVMVSSPIEGDALIAGGSVDVRKAVEGDVRVVGGKITIEDIVDGDLFAVGGTVKVLGTPSFAWVGGGTVSFEGGANRSITAYGGSIFLAGTFKGDVTVSASDSVVLADKTIILGALRYDAPQQAQIPDTAKIAGGVTYTGDSYLPSIEEAQRFAIVGAGIFFLVRILAAVIAVGLLAGLFPRFAQAVADRALSASFTRFVLHAFLGFGVLVAVPALILLLFVSFAGAGIAFVLLAAYALLVLLAYFYAAVIAGAALSRHIVKRATFYWRDAVFGMLVLSLISLVPIFGGLVFMALFAAAAGTIVMLCYRFAYPRHEDEVE